MQNLSIRRAFQSIWLPSYRRVGAMLLVVILAAVTSLAQAEGTAKKPDVRLVIDISGSMKLNDPTNLRQPAVDLLVKLMPEGGKAGIWTFGMYVNMLVPHQLVNDKWREQASGKSSEINSVGLFTNIGAALESASRDATAPGHENFSTSIILLTDGMVDISKDPAVNTKERRRIVEEVLPELKNAGFTIHTVALSDKADKELMERLAVSTDGTFAVAHTAEDLMKIFLNAFAVAAPAQELPLQDNRFAVDSSVDDFTALVFRQKKDEKTQLVGPDKKHFSAANKAEGVKWYRTDTYDLITVDQPLEGEWQILADVDPSSRITVVSDLSIRVKDLPNNEFRGATEEFSFLLEEEGKTVTSPEFLSLLESTLTMDYQVGKDPKKSVFTHSFKSDAPPANGTYSVKLPTFDKIGNYDLTLIVDGKTFKRQFNHHVVVREPFSVDVVETKGESGATEYAIKVASHSDSVVVEKTHVVATIVLPDTHSITKPLLVTEIGSWQGQLKPTLPGDYTVTVQVTGEENGKKPFSYILDPVVFSYHPDAVFGAPEVKPPEPPKEEPKPEVKEEPKVEAKEEPKEEPKVEPKPKIEEPAKGMPSWMLYLLLGGGNLIVFGGGFLAFRKLMGGDDEAVIEEPVAPVPQAPAEPEAAEVAMDAGDEMEEEPPMEDLDTIEIEMQAKPKKTEDLVDDMLDEFANELKMDDGSSSNLIPPEVEDDIDDLDDMLVEQIAGNSSAEEKAAFAADVLKAQGLDLPEDKLDEAISSLIDDLDGTRPEPLEERRDDDFDDDDNWDKMS